MPSLTLDTVTNINASRDEVWDILTDFASYEEWNPFTRIEGVAEVGTKLTVRMSAGGKHGMSFRPKVLAATPGKELRWLGRLGFQGIADGEHFFVLKTNDDGTTRLNHGERFSGALVALAKRRPDPDASAYEAFSQALKQRVESLREAEARWNLASS